MSLVGYVVPRSPGGLQPAEWASIGCTCRDEFSFVESVGDGDYICHSSGMACVFSCGV